MDTNACVTPLSLNTEISVLPRLINAFTNGGRTIVSLRYRLFRKRRTSEPAIVVEPGLLLATKGVHHRLFAPIDGKKSPDSAEFIQSQSQLMDTMLHSMILACGQKVDGSATRNGSKPDR